jgi:hypothetical protein
MWLLNIVAIAETSESFDVLWFKFPAKCIKSFLKVENFWNVNLVLG